MNDTGHRLARDRVNDLLAEWIEHRETGEDISVAVLCREEPGLVPALSSLVARLKQTDWLFDERPECRPPDPAIRAASLREDAVYLAASLSAHDLLERVAQLQAASGEWKGLAKRVAGADGVQLARQLIDCDVVTPFQLQYLCRDRGRDLVLGEYLLLEQIGEGGMGRVYKARQRSLDRVVALKVLTPRPISSPEAASRFQREIAAAARLNHPQIIRVYEAGVSRGQNYLVMEHVEGTDLATLVERSGPLPVGRAIDCVMQAAHALQYVHGEGVVHRDVKPSNLLLDTAGRVKVLDLGLARVADVAEQGRKAAGSLTGSGQVIGTLDYLAPEQARDSRQADQRSDIYSLGCTLYALLHGRPMYDSDSLVSRLLAHQNGPIPSLCAGHGDIARGLESVFRRMVAKRPAKRFQSMGELLSALNGVVSPSSRKRT